MQKEASVRLETIEQPSENEEAVLCTTNRKLRCFEPQNRKWSDEPNSVQLQPRNTNRFDESATVFKVYIAKEKTNNQFEKMSEI